MTQQNANLQIKVENIGISATKEELERLTQAGANAERATDGLTRTIKEIPKSGNAANDSMSRMRNIAGGLGYQLQDVAIQAQSGADGFVILGQQGSQIASIFGPGGVVAGAIIAIGSALVGAGLKASDTGADIKELEENALQLKDAFDISSNGTLAYNERLQRLATTAPSVADALFRIKTAQLELEQTLTEGALRDSLEDFEDLSKVLEERTTQSFEKSRNSAWFLQSTLMNLTKEFGGTNQQIIAVTRALDDFKENSNQDTAISLVDSLSALNGGSREAQGNISKVIALLGQYIETAELLNKSEQPYQQQNKAVQSLVESLRLEAETLNMTNRERDLYIAKLGEASGSQLAAINAAYDQIEADRSRTAIERLQSQLLDEEARIDESYMRRREIIMANTIEGSEQQNELLRENWDKYEADFGEFQNRLLAQEEAAANRREQIEARVSNSIIRQKEGVISSGIALLRNLTAGNEKAAKAIVVVEAGLNIARTMQNTAAAQVRALAELGPIAGPPAAAKIGAYGAVQVGIIAANGVLQIGGGGGFTSSPAISGYQQSSPQPTQVERYKEPDPRPIQFIFNGNFTAMDAETVANMVKDHVDKTDFVLIEKASRNGQELSL